MQLRDLREDLRQRLKMLSFERAQLTERMKYLDDSEQHLQSLLAYEELRVRLEDRNLTLPFMATRNDLLEPERSKYALFLQDALADGRTHSLDDLKKFAEDARIDFDGKQPGRVLHFALLGMAQNGSVEMVEKGVWRMIGKSAKQ